MKQYNTSLENLKTTYDSVSMSDAAYQKMLQRMEDGRNDRKKQSRQKTRRAWIAAAAAAIALCVLPNTSSEIAYAMNNIPVLGHFFQVVTIREYEYESEKNFANVTIPELQEEQNTASTKQINREIQEIADRYITEFEANIADGNHQDLDISYEILQSTEDYFTLKLICAQTGADGYEEDYFYTLSTQTGEQLSLGDFFPENSDYKALISQYIKNQMREQMKSDETIRYWIDDEDMPEFNFTGITDDTAFYINEAGNFVICFQEGEVAPMYMGTVEFEIPAEILSSKIK